jgi:tetratricopeptide (TPR) repeat protein
MAGQLTVSERILFHLNGYIKFEDKYEVPFDITQDGISQACSISRAHAAIELKKLKATGILEEKLSHVRRGKARRKVYFLTMAGKSKAGKIVQHVHDNEIDTMVDPTRISPDVTSRSRATRKSSPLPRVGDFFGREKELESLNMALGLPSVKVISIRGIAGIGKTTLAAKLCSDMTGQRVFWYSAKPWDSTRTFADALSRFFLDNGSRRLANYLSTGKTELSELSFLLNEELEENGFTFVFDDAEATEALKQFLRMFRHSSGSAKIIVTSESQPSFYDRSDIVAKKDVVELELGGLDKRSAMQLLGMRGIEAEVAEELVRVTHGHPLSLEMVTASTPIEARYQVSRFLEDRFYAALAEPEKSLLQYSSVFQQPFPPDALPKDLRNARKGSMLREVAPGRFEIHSSLRDFVYTSMTSEERSRWHSAAADYYLRADNLQERLYHLIRANRSLEAEIMISHSSEGLLGQGSVQRLWSTISSFEPARPKYAPAVLMLKAKAASLAGQYDAAWALLEESSRMDDPGTRAESLVEMGKIKSKKGELKAAYELFSKALDLASENTCMRAKALRGMGVVEGKLGNYAVAQDLLERSARDSMAAMDSKGMLLAHLELGNILIGRGLYQDAIDHFSKCAAGFGPVDLTSVHINLGIANASLGRTGEARTHLENAIRLADDTGQPRQKAYALVSLAELLVKSKEVETAKEHCFTALEILSGLDDRLGVSAVYANLGLAERSYGNFGPSEEYYGESISTLDGMGVPRSLGTRKMEYGLMLLEKGDREGAAKLLGESRKLFADVGARDLLERVESELGRISR